MLLELVCFRKVIEVNESQLKHLYIFRYANEGFGGTAQDEWQGRMNVIGEKIKTLSDKLD